LKSVRFAVIAAATALSSLVACGPAMAGKAHEHGAGKLNLVQEGTAYSLELELPLDTLVGFERAPRTDAERRAAQAAMARLRDADALFRTQPASTACTVSVTGITAPLLEAPAAGASTNADAKPASKAANTGAQAAASTNTSVDTHADATATYTLHCPPQATPQRLELRLFEAFPRLKRLEVQTVLASGQGRLKLSPSNRQIDLRR
jgi:hypothetical protein